MKNTFKAFYNETDSALKELWESDSTLFVFDTNILLNLYSYAEATQNDFFSIVESIKDRIWIPYHVGLEYQRRRLDVIKNEKKVFKDVKNCLSKIQKVFTDDFQQLKLEQRLPELHEATESLKKEINTLIEGYNGQVQQLDSGQPCVRSHDDIRSKIDGLFDGKIGSRPENQEWLDSIYEEGTKRFDNNTPPGFKDSGKGKGSSSDNQFEYDTLIYQKQYGDLILWKQLLQKAKPDTVDRVVFVTDDKKSDWWESIDSNGKKYIGPLPSLRAEIYEATGIHYFHMYDTSSFLKDGSEYLNRELNENSFINISDVQQLNTYFLEGVAVEHPESHYLQKLINQIIDDNPKILETPEGRVFIHSLQGVLPDPDDQTEIKASQKLQSRLEELWAQVDSVKPDEL